MTGLPRAETEGLVAIEAADLLIVQAADGREIACLDRLLAAVWRRADGRTPVAEIARLLSAEFDTVVDSERIWSALDQLADLGLIAARITPPAMGGAVSRRGVLHLGLAGGIVGAALAPLPAGAATEEQNQKAAERTYKNTQLRQQQEQAFKRDAQEKNTKASTKGSDEAQEQMRKDSQRRQEQNSKRQEQSTKAQEQTNKSQERSSKRR